MSKIELPNVTSGYNLARINDNFQKIEDALNQEVLYRTSYVGEPNEMQTNLDMNSNRILNVTTGDGAGDLVTKGYVDQQIAIVADEVDTKYDKSGGPLTGPIQMGGNDISNIGSSNAQITNTQILYINGVQVVPGNSVIDPLNGTREALRRSYTDSGHPLIAGSFEVGGTVTTKTQALLFEASGKAYSWGGTLPKVVPPNSTPSSSGGISPSAWIDKSQTSLSKSVIYVRNYQDTWDGVTDNTTAMREAHLAANLINASVSYEGIKDFAVQANAAIPINTSVDFCGATLHVLNGVVAITDPENTCFLVFDPASPISTLSNVTTPGSLKAGSVSLLEGVLTHQGGFAYVKAPLKIPNRTMDGLDDYSQSFAVGWNGKVIHGLSVDLTSYNGQLTIEHRAPSRGIEISGLNLDPNNFNRQIIFQIERNSVAIRGLTSKTQAANIPTINRIIRIFKGAHISIDGISCPCQTTGGSESAEGTYVLQYRYAANIHVRNMTSLGGFTANTWHSMAGDHVNGIYFTECQVKRIDGHAGFHNVFIDKCTLNTTGITYGWGGGILRVSDCAFEFIAEGVATRGDYGGNWFGTIAIDGISFDVGSLNLNRFTVLNLLVGANVATTMPKVITINGVTQTGLFPSSTLSTINISLMRNAAAVGTVVAPETVTVSDITSTSQAMLCATLDWGSFERSVEYFNQKLDIRGVSGVPATNTRAIKGNGLVFPAASIVPSAPATLNISVESCDSLLIDSSLCTAVRNIDVTKSTVHGIVTPLSSSSPRVVLRGCRLELPASGFTEYVQVGGDRSGSGRYTTMDGCIIAAAKFDLTRLAAATGCLFETGTDIPTIPVGWTFADMFNGIKTATFR